MSQFKPNKRRKLSPEGGKGSSNGVKRRDANEGAADWDLEQAYEHRAKKVKSKETHRLPIKTSQGWQQLQIEEPNEPQDHDSFLGSESDNESVVDLEKEEEDSEEPQVSPRQQILDAKEELARLALLINEDPEEHLTALKSLAKIAASRNPTVKKLALATQCAVYKDIVPGYRIRPWDSEDVSAKLSKEVRKLRAYEQALVSGYQNYVKELEQLSRGAKGYTEQEKASLASVALTCACMLLMEVPHFNFRGDIIKLIVTKLSRRRVDEDFDKCLRTIEKLFETDDEGRASMDVVSQLTKMIKGKNYEIHESVLNTFLHLRLLSEFTSKASHEKVDKVVEDTNAKKQKEKRIYLTKRERKKRKELRVIDKEMKEADAVVSHEERDKMQAEMLKLVFATYFRILKAGSSTLMGAVLEGLARYAHLINQDFFGDILEALKDLINAMDAPDDDSDDENEEDKAETARSATRESLLCAITAFALLQGQDASKAATNLHLDLSFFIAHLYQTILPVSVNADIELGPKSLHLADPLDDEESKIVRKVNYQTTTVLLIRCLSSVLLPTNSLRAVPPLRLAAFTKQLMTASLQLPEKSCLAMLSLLASVAKVHGRKLAALWNTEERRGDGVFDAERKELESSNPFATTVWEGELLRLHYCPKVRESAKSIQKGIREAQ